MFLLLKYFQQLKDQTEPFAVGPGYIPRFLYKLRSLGMLCLIWLCSSFLAVRNSPRLGAGVQEKII